MHIFLDIETIPTQRADLRAWVGGKVTPPASIKKSETLAKWEAEERPQAEQEAWERTALTGMAQIVCIGVAVDDGEPKAFIGGSERTLLTDFAIWLDAMRRENHHGDPRFVGHNLIGFDLLMLKKRAIVHGLRLPLPFDAGRWDKSGRVFDTMLQWDQQKFASLDELCQILEIEQASELTGADVWPLWQAGRHEEIAAYCAEDVRLVREVYHRMTYGFAR